MRGILAGALALVTLHTLVAYKGPASRLNDVSRIAVGVVDRFLDPTRPAIGEGGKPASDGDGKGINKPTDGKGINKPYPAPTAR